MDNFRPGTWDKNIFNIVHVNNEYNLPERFIKDITVLDIGCHIGSFLYTSFTRGAKKGYGYEVVPDNFNMIKLNLNEFIESGICSIFNKAVWRSDLDNMPKLKIALPPDFINTGGNNVLWGPDDGIEIDTVSLDSIITELGHVDILKIDAEGSEFPILLTSKLLSKVDKIVGEFHEVNGEFDQNSIPESCIMDGYDKFTIDNLTEFLNENGFKVKSKRSGRNLGIFEAVKY